MINWVTGVRTMRVKNQKKQSSLPVEWGSIQVSICLVKHELPHRIVADIEEVEVLIELMGQTDPVLPLQDHHDDKHEEGDANERAARDYERQLSVLNEHNEAAEQQSQSHDEQPCHRHYCISKIRLEKFSICLIVINP